MPYPASKADALRIEISSTEVRHLAALGTIAGVAVLAVAAKNGPGSGRLRNVGGNLGWRAPGSATFGPDVNVTADGIWLLCDGEDVGCWIRVQVYFDNLAGEEAEVLLRDRHSSGSSDDTIGSDDVSAAEASAGDIETFTVELRNDSQVILSQVIAWLDAATADLEISDDGAAWVSPTTEGAGLSLADIPAAGSITLHFRRTIGAASSSDPDVLNHIHLSFSGA